MIEQLIPVFVVAGIFSTYAVVCIVRDLIELYRYERNQHDN